MIRKKRLKADIADLQRQIARLGKLMDIDKSVNADVARNLQAEIIANTKFIRSVSSRVSAIRPGFKKTLAEPGKSGESEISTKIAEGL